METHPANVSLGLDSSRITDAQNVLAQVGLAERANDWPATLSGGQRQRVALARALVHDPSLLLLDEPLGALDALTRIEMQQLIEEIWRSRGFTALLVTHDVAEAITLADRVILIEAGRVALDEDVNLPRPRTRGSARFAALEERILSRVLQGRSPGTTLSRPQGVSMPNEVELTTNVAEEISTPRYPLHPLLAQRRSLRAFCSRCVDSETLGSLLEAARWAPSSMNEQPWSFVVATQQNEEHYRRLLGCLLEFNIRWAQERPGAVAICCPVDLRFQW